jgi:hypothetical protein
MKKLLLVALVLVIAFSTVSFAAKAVDWNIVKTTTEAQSIYCPSSGIFKEVGATKVYLTLTTNSTVETYSVLFYQSNGTSLLSTESVTVGDSKTLLTPYFRLLATCGAEPLTARGTAEVYILN